MPLVSHLLWGALFCLPFGFSFDALRLSTLSLSLAGILALYLLARALCHRRVVALVAAFTLAFNPLYFALSHTFMTDVPFTALTIVAVLCLVRSVQRQSFDWWFAGAVVASVATLSRQAGALLLPAFVVVAHKHRWPRNRATRWTVVTLGALFGGLLVWGLASASAPGWRAWARPAMGFAGRLVREPIGVVANPVVVLLYLGLFTLPVALARSPASGSVGWLSRALLGVIATPALLALGLVIPIGANGNVLVPQGIGPLTLRDTFILGLGHVAPLPRPFWVLVTVLAATGAVAVLEAFVRGGVAAWHWIGGRPCVRVETAATATLLLSTALLLTPFLVLGGFDRYLLPIVALVNVLILAPSADLPAFGLRPRSALLSGGAVLFFAAFSVGATHDYLAWNRVRWDALSDLTSKQGVSPRHIDGGFEFNGWYLYADGYRRDESKSWWWVQDDQYVVAFGVLPGYEVVARHRCARWLPPGEQEILTLRRVGQ